MSEPRSKKELAMEFLRALRNMDPPTLNRLITSEAGEELSDFFLQYSQALLQADPRRIIASASGLMMLGYLIRAREELAASVTPGKA